MGRKMHLKISCAKNTANTQTNLNGFLYASNLYTSFDIFEMNFFYET